MTQKGRAQRARLSYAPNNARRTAATNHGYSGLSGDMSSSRASHSGQSAKNLGRTPSSSALQKQQYTPITPVAILDGLSNL